MGLDQQNPTIDLASYLISEKLILEIPGKLATTYQFMPVFKIGKTLTIATHEPDNLNVIDQIQKELGMDIDALYAPIEDVKNAIKDYYGLLGDMEEVLTKVQSSNEDIFETEERHKTINLGIDPQSDSPVVNFVNLIINQAIIKDASDIHIEPSETDILVRIRVDGELQDLKRAPKKMLHNLVSRIKVLGGMDIAETRKPQDGHFQVHADGAAIELRISILPTIQGENVVIRLLGKNQSLIHLSEIGFAPDDFEKLETILSLPQGLLLVTGPTGSGKTTTLYAALNKINRSTDNIITLEDPVEYKLPLIRQVQVNPKAGLTFSTGLRSILRQDPDTIMVGEIRDAETAELAIRSALTGHFVMSTLHTNDAPSSIVRLIDMGVAPFLVSSSITGIIAQRLVRKICASCKTSYQPDATTLRLLGLNEDEKCFKGKGCKTCNQSGFKGRLGLFEILLFTEAFRDKINSAETAGELRKLAMKHGMKSLMQDGKKKIQDGLTTPEEVLRTTQFLNLS